ERPAEVEPAAVEPLDEDVENLAGRLAEPLAPVRHLFDEPVDCPAESAQRIGQCREQVVYSKVSQQPEHGVSAAAETLEQAIECVEGVVGHKPQVLERAEPGANRFGVLACFPGA